MATPLRSLYEELNRSFAAPKSDLKKCGSLLAQLKIGLIEAGLLIPQGNANPEDLIVARDILEVGAIWSIRSRDEASFDRYFSQLLTFYTDYASALPPSKREYPIRGLNLTRLLTQNRIADFHTTLESLPIPADAIGDNPYIAHPVNLERWLMEGSYHKVWNARTGGPAEEYKYFIESLIGTIRNEIASCEEAAYTTLPMKDASLLLFFDTSSELLTFAQKRGWQIDLTGQTITFARKDEEKKEFPTERLIQSSLLYARELEQIV